MPKLSPGPGLSAQEVAAHQLARIYDAMIEIVAEQGYKALKVRDLVSHAEVSTRAFYEHFSSKEDCFLQTYQLISRRATRRIIAAQAGEPDWRERPRLVFEAFVEELEKSPSGARLALLDAYTAGEAALAQAQRVERNFEGMFAEALSRTPRGVVVPPLIVQGMVAGVATVSRNRLMGGKVADLASNREELLEWAMCYPSPAAAELSRLDQQSVWRNTALQSSRSRSDENDGREPTGDRALILNAVAELAASKDYASLTVPRIRSTAKVSRSKFEAYFDDLEDCYLAALELRTSEAMSAATRAQTAATSKAGGIYRAIAALSEYLASDSFLRRVFMTRDFPPGPNGQRVRRRLIDATVDLLFEYVTDSPIGMTTEASAGAVWALFQTQIAGSQPLRSQVPATLSYMALAPKIGAASAIVAIRDEQSF